ncbi:MAG: PCMD domain-containing protein [Aestuariibaculum sp.]
MKSFFSLLVVINLFTACVDEDYFGSSANADILKIELSSQSGTPVINTEKDSVYVEVANGTDLSKIELRTLEVSPFANASVAQGDILDFSNRSINIDIKAEDGTISNWIIGVFEIGSEPQIANSDFSVWYQAGSYLDLGEDDASSAWGTSNPGAVFGGLDPNVIRIETQTGNYAVKLVTRFTFMGSIVNKPIAAGSVFTGDFLQDNISLSNPLTAVNMGIPFTAMPTSFNIDYQYTPGEKNIDANQNELSYPDTGDIYILLERREDDVVKRVATAWHRIETGNAQMETVKVNFVYGELPTNAPDYMKPQGTDVYATESETPTHIKVVFSSSAYGDYFQGAVNSTLIVDNLVLNY